jgi:GNAT superfamily N-acetyltransferase
MTMLAERLVVNDADYLLRSARRDDVAAIVALLADDVLGQQRESAGTDREPYLRAFAMIEAHPNQELVVVEHDGDIVATFDLAILASLSRQGGVRLQVEAVRVAREMRGSGLGGALFAWIVDHARRVGCDLVQLTSDASRGEAHAFYERLGFTGSHVGFKLDLRAAG